MPALAAPPSWRTRGPGGRGTAGPALVRGPAPAAPADVAIRRNARTLHGVCAELLPGYAAATREQWRQSLLTAGILAAEPRRPARRRPAPRLIVEDVVHPSDVLCALWLARRCGLFWPGSPCGDGIGLRSACDIEPEFAHALPGERRAAVLEALRANAAWRAHLAARS